MQAIDWLIANAGSIAVGSIVLAAVVAIVVGMVRKRKKGKPSCGCGCAGCALAGQCHASKNE